MANPIVDSPEKTESFTLDIENLKIEDILDGQEKEEDPEDKNGVIENKKEDPDETTHDPDTEGDGDDPPEQPEDKIEDDKEDDEGEEEGGEGEEDDNSAEETTLIQDLADRYGLQIAEDAGYEDTIQGVLEFNDDVLNLIIDQRQSQMFEQYPELGEFHTHLSNGGTAKDYFAVNHPETDYADIKLVDDDSNIGIQKSIMREFYLNQGVDETDVISAVDSLESAGSLYGQAIVAKAALVKQQAKAKEEYAERQAEITKNKIKKAEEHLTSIKDTLSSGAPIAGVVIPKSEHARLIEYMTTTVKGTETQRDLDAKELGYDKQVLMSFLIMKGLNLDGIVEAKAKTQQSKNLKKRLLKGKEKAKNKQKVADPKSDTKVDVSKLNLSIGD